jgi:DNA-binding CsgD family transcriptional regulator
MLAYRCLRDAQVAALFAGTALERISAALLLLNESRHILYASQAASVLLSSSAVLTMRSRRLISLGARDNAVAVERALSAAERGQTSSVCLTNAVGMLEYRLTVSPLSARVRDQLTYPKPSILVLIEKLPLLDSRSAAEVLGATYTLTHAEVRILDLVLRARSRKQVAEDLGVSVETVHSHLGHIFSKTRTRNQRELQRLGSSIAARSQCAL